MMVVLIFISLGTFVAFVTAVTALFGIPGSLSDSFYLLEIRKRGLGYVFTLWCWVVALTV